jgi:orotidine-5'-phosphate decarboxylase
MGDPLFVDRLLSRVERVGAPVCVGLDPVVDRLPAWATGSTPAERATSFCLRVIDATADVAAAFKPQSACFERLGAAGAAALGSVIAHARERGVPVVLDAKRGDIGETAAHYAAAAVGLGADAITASAYLGPSTLVPYLDGGLGVFVLVRTSNADSGAVQSLRLADGRSVGDAMAGLVRACGSGRVGVRGMSDVGAVVGLTKAVEAAGLRALMPEQVFLVPGYGAQGGAAEDLRPLLGDAGVPGRGVLVNASRSVIYAEPRAGETWREAVSRAARQMHADLRTVL